MNRPIAPGLSPNTTKKDAFLALTLLFQFWNYTSQESTLQLEKWFRDFFSVKYATSFGSGREALFALLQAASVGEGDEVLVQAFTCLAVIESILSTGAKPIYIDCTTEFKLDIQSLKKKLSKKTKLLIAQHTFGIPCFSEDVLAFIKKNNIVVIEDVAHTIGGTYKNKKLGTIGDGAIFSFGRDKAFSSVWGGIATTNNKVWGEKLSLQKARSFPHSFLWTLQQLLHPILFTFIILPFYDFCNLGKFFLVVFQKLHMLSLPVSNAPHMLTLHKMPNSLCALALYQLSNSNSFNTKRSSIAKTYNTHLLPSTKKSHYLKDTFYLRYPLFVEDPKSLYEFCKDKNIYLGKWYWHVIDPEGVNLANIYYTIGMCPNAEYIAKHVINLPTYPTLSKNDVGKVIQQVNLYDESN